MTKKPASTFTATITSSKSWSGNIKTKRCVTWTKSGTKLGTKFDYRCSGKEGGQVSGQVSRLLQILKDSPKSVSEIKEKKYVAEKQKDKTEFS